MAYKISKTDKEKYYDYILKYEKELSHFGYRWNDEILQKFLKEHDIKDTVQSGKYWIYLTTGYSGKDKAFSILRRFRNSIAHGNIKKGRKYYYVYDFSTKGDKKEMLNCQLPVNLFWKLIETICATRIKE